MCNNPEAGPVLLSAVYITPLVINKYFEKKIIVVCSMSREESARQAGKDIYYSRHHTFPKEVRFILSERISHKEL